MKRRKYNSLFNSYYGSSHTLREILVVVIIGGILLTTFGSAILRYNSTAYDNAYNGLISFSETHDLTPGSCQTVDTNNNQYISCTATNAKGEILTLECSVGWMGNHGCHPKTNMYYPY